MQQRICREMVFLPLINIWGTFESIARHAGSLHDATEIGLQSFIVYLNCRISAYVWPGERDRAESFLFHSMWSFSTFPNEINPYKGNVKVKMILCCEMFSTVPKY